MTGRMPVLRQHDMVDVGGAFGARTAPFSEYPLLLYMAKKLGRPIKWVSTRSEDFLTDNHGRAIRLEGELAFDSRGRFKAMFPPGAPSGGVSRANTCPDLTVSPG